MRTRVPVYLDEATHTALQKLAKQEYRDPRAQAALIIRRALELAGLLPAELAAQVNTLTPPAEIGEKGGAHD